jgi:HlyD family secretion protein
MKKWIALLVVAAAAGWGVWQWQQRRNPAADPGTPSPARATAVIEQRDIHFAITAAGEIGPADQVSVRPEINGRIASLPVDLGDSVRAGQVLFTLDDKDLQIERSQRQTEIDGARLQVERAQRNFRRSQELFEENLISLELFEDTRTEFELAKNALERAQKALQLVEDRLSKTKVVAPFDCTVLTRPISVGQAVSGAGGMNSGTEVLTIANLDEMIITAHINQADVTRLRPGQPVDVEVEAVPGLKLVGTIERIAPQATIKHNIKGFATRIHLKNPDRKVRPGMTANLTIPVASAANVVAAPLAAVFTEEEGRFALVQTDDGFEKRPVQIGVADYHYVEVLSGLAAGEIVSLVPRQDARPATAVGGPGNGGNGPGGRRKSAAAD